MVPNRAIERYWTRLLLGAIVVSSTVSLGALLIAKAIGYSLPTVLTATMGGVAARVYAAGLKRSR